MENKHRGIQLIRFNSGEVGPNLIYIATKIMYEEQIECPFEFTEIKSKPNKINHYLTNITQFITQPVMYPNKYNINQYYENISQNVNEYMIFRNQKSSQESILFFFDQENEVDVTRIQFYRVQAACFINSKTLALVVNKDFLTKIMIVNRMQDTLDIISEQNLIQDQDYHCIDIKYISLENQRQYLIMFVGFQDNYIVHLYEYSEGTINFYQKKDMQSKHGRLWPIIYQTKHRQADKNITYFYIIGGQQQQYQQSCYSNYQFFSLKNLLQKQKLDSKIVQLPRHNGYLYQNLFRGTTYFQYLVLPTQQYIYKINNLQNHEISISNTFFKISDEREKHKRFLPHQIKIINKNQQTIHYYHVCCETKYLLKNEQIVKKQPLCLLF